MATQRELKDLTKIRVLLERVSTNQDNFKEQFEEFKEDTGDKLTRLDNSLRGHNGTLGVEARINQVESRLGIGGGVIGRVKGSFDPSSMITSIVAALAGIWALIRGMA